MTHFDFIVIGGGIIGTATSRALLQRYPKAKLYLSLPDTQLYRLNIEGVH